MGEKKLWTEFEDNCLKYLKQHCCIQKWSQIALKMITVFDIHERNQKQCRDRYINSLSPNINFDNWSEEDQHKLIDLHRKFGNRWTMIAQNFKGRTDSFVKNHFYSRLRKCIRKLNNQIQNQLKKLNKNYKKFNLNIIFKLTNLVEGNFNKISNEVRLHYEQLLYNLVKASIQSENQSQSLYDDLQQIQTFILSLTALQNLSGLIEGSGKPKRGRGAKKLQRYQITSAGLYLNFNSNGFLQMEKQNFLKQKQNQISFQTLQNCDEFQSANLKNQQKSFSKIAIEKSQGIQAQINKYAEKKRSSDISYRKESMQTEPDNMFCQFELEPFNSSPLEQIVSQFGIELQEYRKSESNCSDLMQELLQQPQSLDRYELLPIFQMD